MADETEPGAQPITVAPPPQAAPPVQEPGERTKYASFYEAWPNVAELRKFTIREGQPRIGLSAEGQAKAQELIDEYRNG